MDVKRTNTHHWEKGVSNLHKKVVKKKMSEGKIKKDSKIEGFTLLEVIIVIAIVGVMAAVVSVSLVPARNEAKVRAAQTESAATIKLAQSYALQGKKLGAVTPNFFGFVISSSTVYKICGCSVANCSDCSGANIIESRNLPAGVTFGTSALALTFNVPDGNINPSADTTISMSGGGISKSITVKAGGAIVEN
jgi:prepilin-type N-terminal cleavage/methylation domain-containing protein